MSYTNRKFNWDLDALKRFYNNYVIKWLNAAMSWTAAQKKQARANLGFGNGDIDDEPTAGSNNLVKSGGIQNEFALGAVYDVSAKNPTAGSNNDGKWESLSALLSDANLSTLIPTSVRKGGMSIKFVCSSDNKYVQCRCIANEFTIDVTQWQSMNADDEPIAGSDNLVKSGGAFKPLLKSIWVNPSVSYFTNAFSYDIRNLIAAAWFTDSTWGNTRDIAISAILEVGNKITLYFDILTEKGNVSSAYHAFNVEYQGKGVIHSLFNDRLKIIFNFDSISDIRFSYDQALIVLSDFIYKNNYQIFDKSIGAEKLKDNSIDNSKVINKTLTREKSNYYINPFDGVNLSYAAPSEIINTVENEGYTTTPTNGTFYTPGVRECRGEIVESDNPCNLKYVRKYITNGGSVNYRLMSLVFNHSAGINKFTIGFLLDITDFPITDYNDGATLSNAILYFSDDTYVSLGSLLFGEVSNTKTISNVGTISYKTYIKCINHYQNNRVWAFVNIRGEFSYNAGVSPLTYMRLSMNVDEVENGKLYYVANLTADFTNDKQLNPILYYGKNIVELNKETEENSQDIEMLKEVVGTDKKNLLHLNLTDDQLSYMVSPFNANNDFKVYFKAKRSSTYTQNPCLNFDSAVLVDKNTEQETVVHSMLDDITPAYYNDSYMGGNHGNYDCVTVTVNNHGKTCADIGSEWKDESDNVFVLVAIESANSLSFYGPNTAIYPFYDYNTDIFTNGKVLTHVNGATHTSSITFGSNGTQKQFRASLAVKTLKFIADGRELTEPGDYYFSHLDICEEYDVFNVASVIEKIKEGVGTFTANPLPNSFDDADKVVRHSIIYGFDAANDWKMSIDFILYQNIALSFYGFTQQSPVEGNSIYMYIPKTLPISNGEETIDFRTIVPYNNVPATMNITSQYWENPQLPPDRWIQYNDKVALHSGYLFDYGVGGNNRKDSIANAFYLYTSRKCYPYGINNVTTHAGDVYSAVVWRKYIDKSDVNTNGVIACNVFEYKNKYYIYADYNAEGIFEIDIPAKYIGKNIEVFESSGNVSLLSSIANAKVLVKVTNASPMYGYLVAQIK